jgi:PAS domain S-box-containing protein
MSDGKSPDRRIRSAARRFAAYRRAALPQLRLLMGLGGVRWAAACMLVGAVCCAVAFAEIAASLHRSDVAPQRALADEVLRLDHANRLLLRSLLSRRAVGQEVHAIQHWRAMLATLGDVCRDAPIPAQSRLDGACRDRPAFEAHVGSAIERFATSAVQPPPAIMAEVMELTEDIRHLATESVAASDRLIDGLVEDYSTALIVLTVCTIGFAGAGAVMILLLARSSLAHHSHWRRAERLGAEAVARRNQLQEIIETLPAGVVVYDAEERLVAFNTAARSSSPVLGDPDVLGMSYPQLAVRSGQRLEAAGFGPQPVEQWIERFRTRVPNRARQALDGRWYDWTEKLTPSGLTIGLRADVTNFKRQELSLAVARRDAETAKGRYQALVESLSDMVFALDENRRFTYVSPGGVELLGAPTAAILGTRLHDWMLPEDAAILSGLTGPSARCRIRTIEGEPRPVELRWSKPRTPTEQVAQVGVLRDVSELEHARAEYESLVSSLGDVAYRLDIATGRFTFVSAAARWVLGREPEAMVGTHFLEYIAPESVEEVRRTTQRPYQETDLETFTRFKMLGPDGAPRSVEVRARRRLDEFGHLISTGVIRDVEDRVALERRLEAHMARLTSIVEAGGALIVLTDGDFTIEMANREFADVTGLGAEEAVGTPLPEWLRPRQPARVEAQAQFAAKFTDRRGHERLMSVTLTPVTDDSGEVRHVVLLGVDETRRREAEQALHDLERFATVGEMASTMAHEISQPVTAISFACEAAMDELRQPLSADGPDVPYVLERLDLASQQVEQASRIIGDLRSFVRGTVNPEIYAFDANEAVRNVCALMDYGLSQAGVTLTHRAANDLPAVQVDPFRLQQILVNLINNARDAGARTIELETGTARIDDRNFVRIAVLDSGPGIPPDVMEKLFHSFVTTKPKGKGTGLGLRICRRLVGEMGGEITAWNRDGGGACFQILLPEFQPPRQRRRQAS